VPVLAASGLLLSGCAAEPAPGAGSTVTVVATTPQVADFVRIVGGDAVLVHQVVEAVLVGVVRVSSASTCCCGASRSSWWP